MGNYSVFLHSSVILVPGSSKEAPECSLWERGHALRCWERRVLHRDYEAKGVCCCCCRPLQLAKFCPPFLQVCSRGWEEEGGKWEAGQMDRKKHLIVVPVVLTEQSLCSCIEEHWAVQELVWTMWTVHYSFLPWAGVPSSSSSLEVEVGITVSELSLSSSEPRSRSSCGCQKPLFLVPNSNGLQKLKKMYLYPRNMYTSGRVVMKINVMLGVRIPTDIYSVCPNKLVETSCEYELHSAVLHRHLTSWMPVSLQTHL